jgi:hypothetical protein
MALWPYSFFDAATAKAFLRAEGERDDSRIEDAVSGACRDIEAFWGRHIVSRGTLTEYHPRYGASICGDLYLNEWPVGRVTSVTEAGTALTVSTDYRLVKAPASKLVRLSGGFPVAWPLNFATSTYRHVAVVYLAGYRPLESQRATIDSSLVTADWETLQAIPEDVLDVARDLTAWIYGARKPGGAIGVTQVSDGQGNRTFTGPPVLTAGMKAKLLSAGATAPNDRLLTGERDVA